VPQTHEIAILGANPAGLTAAYRLAKKRRDVVVLAAPRDDSECPLSTWLPGDVFTKAHLPRTVLTGCRAKSFRGLRFHSAQQDRHVDHRMRQTAGYFVETDALRDALTEAVRKAGATIRTARKPATIRLEEDHVRLVTSRSIRAQLLIVCQGHPARVLRDVSMRPQAPLRPAFTVTALDVPLGGRQSPKFGADMLHVLELPERTELGLFFRTDKLVHLRVVSQSTAAGNRAAELSQMAATLQSNGLLPRRSPLQKARGAVWTPPAGTALEMETHVAKRCLLAGTAGGFADGMTGNALPASMRSAVLAADVAAQSVGDDDPQGTLRKFHTGWQKQLADGLRPPSTSLQMLLPLLFVNPRIAGKFARALLYGEPI